MENNINMLVSVKKTMFNLGYNSFQIDAIVQDVIGPQNTKVLNDAEVCLLIEALQEYIFFAEKCKKVKL